jgi:hypothetical protein
MLSNTQLAWTAPVVRQMNRVPAVEILARNCRRPQLVSLLLRSRRWISYLYAVKRR